MKKAYETPSVEKIAFNYRDQVVAASGDPIASGNNGSTQEDWGDVLGRIVEGLGSSLCKPFFDWIS
ncbi:MAG: hypothetical protein IKU70_13190 [Clostridia bacterium]|nr:hypothetical protein [Clostridia bacterium]